MEGTFYDTANRLNVRVSAGGIVTFLAVLLLVALVLSPFLWGALMLGMRLACPMSGY